MFANTTTKASSMKRLLAVGLAVAGAALSLGAQAASPGITGSGTTGTFSLTAQEAYLTQPDGQSVYSWGYGCADGGTAESFAPALTGAFCTTMQIPGPTLIVTEGQPVSVTLTNNLPAGAGNTSILFPGFNVTTSCSSATPVGTQGLLTCEAVPGGQVTYTFTPTSPGTRSYYSGTQGDLQVEMGLYGAVVVLPAPAKIPAVCTAGLPLTAPGNNAKARANWGERDFRLAASAYDHASTCYDREYLFQLSEMDLSVHNQAMDQVAAVKAKYPTGCVQSVTAPDCALNVATEPYRPAYFMVNGRSMPDNMDPNFSPQYPHQPYNGNPHMHPGEITLLRIVGQGRWQHPLHEHGNHVRILARDGNLILTPDGTGLAGGLFFTTTTTPGTAMDGLFYFTGRGLNWDMYAHNPTSKDPNAVLACTPDVNGYNTLGSSYQQINYFEWCQDHDKPMEVAPFGDVPSGGPVTLPDANIYKRGAWYGGSPYLGPDATSRDTFGTCSGIGNATSCSTTGTTPPSGTVANNPSKEAGFAFMWHSHNEREITTNNIFPGGMLMMMLVDSREFVIDESN
jgi:FtsP/CotA-like multicopper oxidase with cupredoxin domain